MNAVALVVAAVVAAGAPGFPSFDTEYERVLMGKPPVLGARAAADALAREHGTFASKNGALYLATPAPYGESTWIYDGAAVDDGIVRARFVVGAGGVEKLDVGVLVRAKVASDHEIDEGYAATIDKGTLKLARYEHRVIRLLGAETKIDGALKTGDTLEVVVVVAGPFINATVYDGTSLLARAHVEMHDRRNVVGGVGVRIGKASDAGVSLLTVGSSARKDPHEVDRGDGDDVLHGAGERRDVVDDNGHITVTDPIGLERLMRAGTITPTTKVRTQTPWKHQDAVLTSRLGKPPTSTATGFRVDESYKDAEMVSALLHAYAEKFPKLTRLETIGTTTDGRAVQALAIGKRIDGDVDTILLDGAHHGGELMAIEFVLDAVQQLLEVPANASILDAATIYAVPLVNVDGNMRYVHETRDYDRKNGRDVDDNKRMDGWDGVDLYRNYPADWGGLGEVGSRSNPYHYRYRGPSAASEPEPQAMMRLAERERFTSSIDYHTNATAILVPYTDPNMQNPDLNEAWSIALEVQKTLPTQVNGRAYSVQRNLYPVDGTYQDWLRLSFGTVALLVEGPENNALPYKQHRDPAVAGTRGTWQALVARTLSGPGVVGHVRDVDGKPVEAVVSIDEQHTHLGEKWTSRPHDGRFHRLLPAGKYTLRVSAAGYTERVLPLDIRAQNRAVDVVLDRAP